MKQGKVFLVGAGSGDPALLTIKGQNILKQAEVVLYDRLMHPGLLYLIPKDAEIIYCGKLPNKAKKIQENIIMLLLEYAKKGKKVVRLKGGDPSVFGRVTEEIEALEKANIEFQIIPGITTAAATSSYNNISLTNRDIGRELIILSVSTKSGEMYLPEFVGSDSQTIAIYMGMEHLKKIVSLLKKRVKSTTDILLCEWATFGRQRKLLGNLDNIIDLAKKNDFMNPTMILIGKITSDIPKLSWFEKLPKFGQKSFVVKTTPVTFDDILFYTEQGMDVWVHDISEFRDRRYDTVFLQYLNDWSYDTIIYEDKATPLLLELFLQEIDNG